MPADKPVREVEIAFVVFLGSFNPAIFQPTWLAQHTLLRQEEAENAKIEVIHEEVTSFEAGWAQVQVTRDQFRVSSEDVNAHELVRDFVSGTFRLLPHTPVSAVGLNHAFHYSFPSYELNERLGDRIIPSEPWPFLSEPHFTNLQVTSARTDDQAGAINVQLQPSARYQPYGLFVLVNDHFDLSEEKGAGAERAVSVVADFWDASRDRADDFATQLIGNIDQ